MLFIAIKASRQHSVLIVAKLAPSNALHDKGVDEGATSAIRLQMKADGSRSREHSSSVREVEAAQPTAPGRSYNPQK